MLFASREVRLVENCDLGLENVTLGMQPQVAFSRPRSQFPNIYNKSKVSCISVNFKSKTLVVHRLIPEDEFSISLHRGGEGGGGG